MEFVVMPDNRLPQEVDGTLAPDVLSAYDDDFDFANNKFYLVSQDHCPGRVVYWTKDAYAEIPMRIDNIGHIDLPVSVDGKPMQATLDTGSSRSLMSLEAAEDLFGFNEKDSSLKPLSSSNEHWHPYRYPFKSLAFEGVIVNNPDLVLISNDESKMMGSGSPKIILGMGVLRQLHLYIAYHEHKLYVTPATAH
ncbi:MAG TPA: aspartyl protease family protein, partial [Rhizomicrobium sp.]